MTKATKTKQSSTKPASSKYALKVAVRRKADRALGWVDAPWPVIWAAQGK